MPGAVVDVGAADPRRLDPHQDLAGPRLRVRGRHLLEGGADPDDLESGDLLDFQIVATFKKAKKKTLLPKLRG